MELENLVVWARTETFGYGVKLDALVKNYQFVMPDLIPAKDGIFDRHPEPFEATNFVNSLGIKAFREVLPIEVRSPEINVH